MVIRNRCNGLLLLLELVMLTSASALAPNALAADTPEEVINWHVAAYNAPDIHAETLLRGAKILDTAK